MSSRPPSNPTAPRRRSTAQQPPSTTTTEQVPAVPAALASPTPMDPTFTPTGAARATDNDPAEIPEGQEAKNEDEDEDDATLPLTMAASVVLDALPRDAHRALESAGELRDARGEVRKKVKIRLSPLAATPALRQPVFLCGAAQRFSFIVSFLRTKLKVPPHAGVHCYVNSVFAPALDEGVGNLWRCFKTGDELVVSYSLAQAFG